MGNFELYGIKQKSKIQKKTKWVLLPTKIVNDFSYDD